MANLLKKELQRSTPELQSLNPEALPKLHERIAEIADAAIAEYEGELN